MKLLNRLQARQRLQNMYYPESNNVVEKSGGEGSKGGKVVGHTTSGKPIYESHAGDGLSKQGDYSKNTNHSYSNKNSSNLPSTHNATFIHHYNKDHGYNAQDHADAHSKLKEHAKSLPSGEEKNKVKAKAEQHKWGHYNLSSGYHNSQAHDENKVKGEPSEHQKTNLTK